MTAAVLPNSRQQATLGLMASACALIRGTSQTNTRTQTHIAKSTATLLITLSF